MQGMTGNGEDLEEQRYYAGGKRAAQGYNRRPEADAYWPGREAAAGAVCVWHVLGGGGRR